MRKVKCIRGSLEKKFLGKCKWDENRMMIVEKCGGYEYSSPPPQLNRLHVPMQHSVGHGRKKEMKCGEGIFQNIQVSIEGIS
jgi:hypothetical protein